MKFHDHIFINAVVIHTSLAVDGPYKQRHHLTKKNLLKNTARVVLTARYFLCIFGVSSYIPEIHLLPLRYFRQTPVLYWLVVSFSSLWRRPVSFLSLLFSLQWIILRDFGIVLAAVTDINWERRSHFVQKFVCLLGLKRTIICNCKI